MQLFKNMLYHLSLLELHAVSSHVVNLPVGLFAFVEVRFYNNCSTAICFYGYQQTFILFLAQPEKANIKRENHN